MIEPRRDAYGPEADTSNLADYIELLALAGLRLRRAELADYLAEQQWLVRSRELFHDPWVNSEDPTEDQQDGGVEASPAELGSERVFELLDTRADALGERYPFVLTEHELLRRGQLDDTHTSYLSLLAITVAHHYDIDATISPEHAFEELVAAVMSARGLTTINTGSVGRDCGDFRRVVEAVGDAVGLVSAPGATSTREYANDEGVDTVSHLSWGDIRPGHWVFIGQATCARSNEWQRKIREPEPPQWAALLNCVVWPMPYLAVPHHVEDRHLFHLSSKSARLVLDRIRLARHLDEVSDTQQALVDAVRHEDIYHPLH